MCPIIDDPVDGVAVLTACFLMLEAGLMMLQAHDIPQSPHDAESESSNESVASDPSVNLVEVYKSLIVQVTFSDRLDGRTESSHPLALL